MTCFLFFKSINVFQILFNFSTKNSNRFLYFKSAHNFQTTYISLIKLHYSKRHLKSKNEDEKQNLVKYRERYHKMKKNYHLLHLLETNFIEKICFFLGLGLGEWAR